MPRRRNTEPEACQSLENWGHDPVKTLEEEEGVLCHNQPGEMLPQEADHGAPERVENTSGAITTKNA